MTYKLLCKWVKQVYKQVCGGHVINSRARFTQPNGSHLPKLRLLAATTLVVWSSQMAFAQEQTEPKAILWTDQEVAALRLLDERANPEVVIRRSYPLGVNRYALNHATRLTGWQVGEDLYFGRAKGEDSGIALVWQRRWNQQVSLSNDGIRLTRHF